MSRRTCAPILSAVADARWLGLLTQGVSGGADLTGGSVRDPEVIEAADKAGLAMVFTGMRHFRH
jgi:hypothetical protein